MIRIGPGLQHWAEEIAVHKDRGTYPSTRSQRALYIDYDLVDHRGPPNRSTSMRVHVLGKQVLKEQMNFTV